jgi:hypothetical protein
MASWLVRFLNWLRAPFWQERPAQYLRRFKGEEWEQNGYVDPLLEHYMHQSVNWLELCERKHLLFDFIHETFVWTRPYQMLARHLPIGLPGWKCCLVLYYYHLVHKIPDEVLSRYPNLVFSFTERSVYIHPVSETSCPLHDYFELLERYWDIDWFILASFESHEDMAPLFPNGEELDLSNVLKRSRTFMIYNADLMLVLGREKEVGSWPPEIEALIVAN